jgi:hypothetical protein
VQLNGKTKNRFDESQTMQFEENPLNEQQSTQFGERRFNHHTSAHAIPQLVRGSIIYY